MVGPIHKVAPTSSSQFAQASAPPVSAAPPSATKRPTLALLAVCQLRCADPVAQDCGDEPVGQQRADDVAELAGAANWGPVNETIAQQLGCRTGEGGVRSSAKSRPHTRRKNATTDHGSNVRIAVSGRVLVATEDLPLVLSWEQLMSAGSCTLTG